MSKEQQQPTNKQQPTSNYSQDQQGMPSTFGPPVPQHPAAMTHHHHNLMMQANMANQQIHSGSSSARGVVIPVNNNGVPAHFLPMQHQPNLQTNQVVATMGLIPAVPTGPIPSSAAYHIPNMPGTRWIPGPGTKNIPAAPTTKVEKDNVVALSKKSAAIASTNKNHVIRPDSDSGSSERKKGKASKKTKGSSAELSTAAKAKQNRERNREHARSTRQRKKAYVSQLKEMAEGLRAIQTEEIRQRRMAVQKMMGVQKNRKTIIQTVLTYHSCYESDPLKWGALIEDSFSLKQPVTPFRSFRRSEVDKDCRIVRGIEAMICDAASLSVMIERIGCRNTRWKQLKREKFLNRLEPSSHTNPLEATIDQTQQAESSLSSESSTDSSCGSSSRRRGKREHPSQGPGGYLENEPKKVSSSSESSDGKKGTEGRKQDDSGDSKSTAAEGLGYSGNEPQSKRQKGNYCSVPQSVSNAVQSGGVIHEVRANNGALKSETNPAVHQVSHNAPVMLSSLSMFPDTSNDLGAYYAVNEDDMIMIEDVLMCPFIFRSKNAVLCGALADCVMPGMLRANFSKANKIQSLEMVFDAMGFMQQLDGANGREVNAQVIPGSLEMALIDSPHEARVITEARPPYCVVHVNEAWSRLTKYSQLEVEGKELLSLIEGDNTEPKAGFRSGKPIHQLEEVAKGRSACSTNIHYDKFGNSFIDFMSSYPLTNTSDEISHLLHVSHELPKMKALI